MIISDKFKLLYYPVMKTGTSSVLDFLEKHYDARIIGECAAQERHLIFTPLHAVQYKKITTVRSPYTRAFSIWRHIVSLKRSQGLQYKNCETFKDFILHFLIPRIDWHAQTIYEALLPCLHFIGIRIKLENVNLEFTKHFSVKFLPIPLLNKKDIDIEYDFDCFDLVLKWAEKDFDVFGYPKNPNDHFDFLNKSHLPS